MKILVACEESQRVTTELRNLGVEAYSCDLLSSSGNHSEWHIKGDCLPLLSGRCSFTTEDGTTHTITTKWDAIFAFPPCTHLAISGARHFDKKRLDGRQEFGINFFCQFLIADCEHILIENPVNIISGTYVLEYFPELAKKYSLPIKPAQRIQPYEYGDPSRKTTCLWLKGLPKLIPTNIVEPDIVTYIKGDGSVTTFSKDYVSIPKGVDRATFRSKTFPGIAKAIATQYYKYLSEL